MFSTTYLGEQVKSFESSPQFDGYSRVTINVSGDTVYTAGTDTGRTLIIDNPWGTQEMASNILARLKNYQYQPYSVSGALLDPAAELGDSVTVHNLYGGIYTQNIKFGRLCLSDISAPADEEIDHEFPYVPHQERKVNRSIYNLNTELLIQDGLLKAEIDERKNDVDSINTQLSLQSGQIAAKVDKTGGSPSSFGWVLDAVSWVIKANNIDILKATESGLEVYGKITATSGKIGGFDITQSYLSYNGQTWGGTNTTGIYIGPSGIQLGKNFKVDAAGNLSAASGTFTGNVYAGSIKYGGSAGYFSGSGLSSGSVYGGSGGAIAGSSISTYNTTGGINTSLGYADFANGVFNGWNTANYTNAHNLFVDNQMTLRDSIIGKQTLIVATPNGGTATIRFLSW